MAKRIKPFDTPGRFTTFDNYVLDNIMPLVSPNAWKCLCFIIRKTVGWHKAEDKISFSQIRAGTGIGSDATVSKSLSELERARYILVHRTSKQWSANMYALNTALEIEVEEASTTETEVVPTTETEVGSTTETVDTKERNKSKQTRAVDPLSLVVESAKNGVSEKTASNPIDQWMQYRDETISYYCKVLGLKPNEAQRGLLGNLAGEKGFSIDTFKKYVDQFAVHGGYKYDVAAAINGYWIYQKTGDIYKAMNKRPLAAPDTGGGSEDVIQNDDGSYYV